MKFEDFEKEAINIKELLDKDEKVLLSHQPEISIKKEKRMTKIGVIFLIYFIVSLALLGLGDTLFSFLSVPLSIVMYMIGIPFSIIIMLLGYFSYIVLKGKQIAASKIYSFTDKRLIINDLKVHCSCYYNNILAIEKKQYNKINYTIIFTLKEPIENNPFFVRDIFYIPEVPNHNLLYNSIKDLEAQYFQ